MHAIRQVELEPAEGQPGAHRALESRQTYGTVVLVPDALR